MFPEIVEVGIKFLQQDEWAAQKRRLNSDFDSCGAGPSAVRDRLVWSIPGLKEFFVLSAEINGKENAANQSMQETTAKELFVAPTKGNRNATRHHSMIPARVPKKRNNESKDNPDFHFCATQTGYTREFAFDPQFEGEVLRWSGDGMTKLKVVTLAVSRFHQIRRFFLEDDAPNFLDHDFPYPGYHLDTSGIMFLAHSGSRLSRQLGEILLQLQSESDAAFESSCHDFVKGRLLASVAHASELELFEKSSR